MPRMGKKKRLEMNFFINTNGRIEHNKLCRACVNECRQSHKAAVIECKKYKSKRGN